jgi:hypothetical protein
VYNMEIDRLTIKRKSQMRMEEECFLSVWLGKVSSEAGVCPCTERNQPKGRLQGVRARKSLQKKTRLGGNPWP